MYQIIWSEVAKNALQNTLIYWYHRNKSDSYPRKISKDILEKENLLLLNPFAGEETTYKGIRRVLILRNFSLFYQVDESQEIIKIITFRDNRKKPKDFNKS